MGAVIIMKFLIILAISVVTINARSDCQKSKSLCYSSDPGLAGIELPPCCEGFECQAIEGSEDRFCIKSGAVPLGGKCESSSTKCIDGVCVAKLNNGKAESRGWFGF